jgi:ATP-dependent helicase/nuclease subunit A
VTTDARTRANAKQVQASDPLVSAFVAASAGSGKTKLLTDRLLRLMLTGADPARIQCLTFTKAAAAEMALRLQRTLGEWVTLNDETLNERLAILQISPTEEIRAASRALFARVLDLPGGMRIGTIHAFCQSLLRRFPLEAELSPHFRLVEEGDARVALRKAREAMLAGAFTDEKRGFLEALAGLTSAEQFGYLVASLHSDRDRLAAALGLGADELAAAQRRVLGAELEEAALLARAVRWEDEAVRLALRAVAESGSAQCARKAAALLDWLALTHDRRQEEWDGWCRGFVLDNGTARGLGAMINRGLADRRPELADALSLEQQRICAIEDSRRAVRVAAATRALLALAGPVAQAYARDKETDGLLDYDDLIGRTTRLLVDPGAAWVLFKLDGGLDHLLLDEVQDTAPAQWQIAGSLTQEFFVGSGAREQRRTVFAVGDRKQSIYSFQGADPEAFEHWHSVMRNRVQDAGETFRSVELDVSFRSTSPVLALVDAVFASPEAACGVVEPGRLLHIADRAGHAGRVELWPLTPPPEEAPHQAWMIPERNLASVSATQRLADGLAGWIAVQCDVGDLPSKGRKLVAGDFLILVRRRNEFARALVRALKTRGVPVAGLDRLVLTEQPAVADLLALCDTLLLPEDDLSLACVLTSPIGGLTDDSLMALAARRDGSLWNELRKRAAERPDWSIAHDFLAILLRRVDYASPHALLAEALGPLGGRARLFARLGAEAAEPVDELLNKALAYAQSHPPSLQGFLHWLRQSGAEVKRESEGAGGFVRIMTVHGAKGLQAPVVILPDTTAVPQDDDRVMWAPDPSSNIGLQVPMVPIWSPRAALRCERFEQMRAEAARRRTEEHNRLLYVALTRAEDRLVICGWASRKGVPDGCWYELVSRGFAAMEAERDRFVAVPSHWEGDLLWHESPQTATPEASQHLASLASSQRLPPWAGCAPAWRAAAPPSEPRHPVPLAPSQPDGSTLGPVPRAASPVAGREAAGVRLRRGRLMHSLLQHLPDIPVDQRPAAAARFLDRPGIGLDASALAAEVLAALDHPAFAQLFGSASRPEVPLTGVVEDVVIAGFVDRLSVLPDRILVADYKTNREPPDDVAEVPVLYLRQMAAYRALLRAIFPDRVVACALIWTVGPLVMPLPDMLLDRHAPGTRAAA